MPSSINNCPLCKLDCKGKITPKQTFYVDCRRCGFYEITFSAKECDYGNAEKDIFLFSGYLRNNSSKGSPITVNAEMLEHLSEIILPFKRLSVTEKINKIITYLGNRTNIGEKITLDANCDFTLFYCKNKSEFERLISYATTQDYLEYFAIAKPGDIEPSLTYKGWQKYEENQNTNITSKNAFIAMNFDPEFDEIFYKAILTACGESDFTAIRVDKSEHNEKICDKIIADIKSSRFLIAEFTGQKHGVYFEAGFAYGLGIPVIWCCRESDVKQLHFDTRQYNHIIWKDIEELKEKLINRIKATVL